MIKDLINDWKSIEPQLAEARENYRSAQRIYNDIERRSTETQRKITKIVCSRLTSIVLADWGINIKEKVDYQIGEYIAFKIMSISPNWQIFNEVTFDVVKYEWLLSPERSLEEILPCLDVEFKFFDAETRRWTGLHYDTCKNFVSRLPGYFVSKKRERLLESII